ncbi:MAG: CHAT domain-containing protein [Microcystaceae cyanobacterium]
MKPQKWIQRICIFCLGLFFALLTFPVMSQPKLTGGELVKQGEMFYSQGNLNQAVQSYQKAVNIFQQQLPQTQNYLAITATNLCKLELESGQVKNALESCQLALNNYNTSSQKLINQTQFYYANGLQQLGFFKQACTITNNILDLKNDVCSNPNLEILETQIDWTSIEKNPLSLQTWGLLGEILRNLGQLETSEFILEKLETTQAPSILLSLGNTYTALGKLQQERIQNTRHDYHPWKCESKPISEAAQNYYNRAIATYQPLINTTSEDIKRKSKLNTLQVLLQQNKVQEAYQLTQPLENELISNPSLLIESNITLATAQTCFLQQQANPDYTPILEQLKTSVQVARQQNDPLLLSHTLGILGSFHEFLDQPNKAEEFTKEALYLAQSYPELAYQWQWQLGRIYQNQQQPETALTYYQSAINTIETIRQDLLTLNSDVQFSFRDKIEPLYRSYIELLLTAKTSDNNNQTLSKVIQQIEALQLAELENFLQCDLSTQTNTAPILDNQSILIYPIQLKDQLAILYQLPRQNNSVGYQSIKVSSEEMLDTLTTLQNYLRDAGNTPEILPKAQQLYQWIITPLEPILKDNPQVNTLAFILDGQLRNIPISVLYDGEKYLLEKDYAIAVIPSLSLLPPQSTPTHSSILTGGIRKAEGFQEITKLEEELNQVAEFHAFSERLIDESFTKANIQEQMQKNEFSVIHWKTHGVFSSNPQKTYLVAYQELIYPNDLSQLIEPKNDTQKRTIDLLVLSACETAQGDNRAVLGLAGMAIKAGAKSTLSTLWRADDQANTDLMAEFYPLLYQPNLTKAQALHQAQKKLFKTYKDPHIWATYILVGNWQ